MNFDILNQMKTQRNVLYLTLTLTIGHSENMSKIKSGRKVEKVQHSAPVLVLQNPWTVIHFVNIHVWSIKKYLFSRIMNQTKIQKCTVFDFHSKNWNQIRANLKVRMKSEQNASLCTSSSMLKLVDCNEKKILIIKKQLKESTLALGASSTIAPLDSMSKKSRNAQ